MTKKQIIAALTTSAFMLSATVPVFAEENAITIPSDAQPEPALLTTPATTDVTDTEVISPDVVEAPPVDPTTPTEPSAPVEPVTPTEPSTPVTPEPTTPTEPEPVTPTEPSDPIVTEPVTPTEPTENPVDDPEPSVPVPAEPKVTEPVKPIPEPVANFNPFKTNTNQTVVGTQNSQVQVQHSDGSVTLVPAESLGGKTNEDGTVTLTTSEGKLTTLPSTGEETSLLSALGLGLLSILGFVLKKSKVSL